VRVIIQARVGSTRLPGKILAPLAGKPVLWHVVRRLEMAGAWIDEPWQVHVATTNRPEDDVTCQWCSAEGVPVVRGPAEDVLARYVLAAEDLSEDDAILRATSDNPLYCPRRTASIVAAHLAAGLEYTCIRDLSHVVPEVIRVGALRRMAAKAMAADCREHVTPYFRRPPHGFRTQELPPSWQGLRPRTRLTIDTAEELARMQGLFSACSRRGLLFSLEEAYRYVDEREAATLARVA
jgi:spore coat polysaccharide biosynthesis protein SpsF (cytidylyltransferase family)